MPGVVVAVPGTTVLLLHPWESAVWAVSAVVVAAVPSAVTVWVWAAMVGLALEMVEMVPIPDRPLAVAVAAAQVSVVRFSFTPG